MDLKEYFERVRGVGVMATADPNGVVDAAIYSRPHYMEDGTLAFIMLDRLTHKNIQTNPHAMFLFKEDGPGYNGKRLFLKMVREETDQEKIDKMKRRSKSKALDTEKKRFLVYFQIEKELPLIGIGDDVPSY